MQLMALLIRRSRITLISKIRFAHARPYLISAIFAEVMMMIPTCKLFIVGVAKI